MCLQNLMNFHHCLFKILKKNQNVTDGRKDGRTTWKQYTPHTNIVCWGYKNVLEDRAFSFHQVFVKPAGEQGHMHNISVSSKPDHMGLFTLRNNFIFLRFMEVWTQQIICKVSDAWRDPLHSYFHEPQKNEIHLLYLHFVFTLFLLIICEMFI